MFHKARVCHSLAIAGIQKYNPEKEGRTRAVVPGTCYSSRKQCCKKAEIEGTKPKWVSV